MLYNDKSKWSTLETGKESKAISRLLGVDKAKILRIGNDTTDESEMNRMDGLISRSKFLKAESSSGDSDFVLCQHNGKMFVREMIEDIVAYYIINEGTSVYQKAISGEYHAGGNKMLTLKDLEEMKPGAFASGEIEN